MPKVDVSKDTLKRLRAFKKLIDYIIEEKLEKEADYVELVLSIGMDKMFEAVVPKDDRELLPKTMIAMFKENPEFVVDFVVRTLKKGEEIQREKELYKKHVKKNQANSVNSG